MSDEEFLLDRMESGHGHSHGKKKKKHGHGHGKKHGHKHHKEPWCDVKMASFIVIGVATLLYVVIELGVAVWLKSLALLSDGFHNLSDVISLYIAFWAAQAAKRGHSDKMSYGWVRSEILGGLTNGCFLLSLCLYVFLDAIPRFIEPDKTISDYGWWFIGVSGGGLVLNTVGTLTFAVTGMSHAHSHAGGGHSHAHGGHEKKKKKKKHGHGHGEKEEHGHGHGKKKHDHGEKEEHGHGKKKHGHSHGKKKKKPMFDMNVYAVFIHYAGDMVSSFLILVTGLLIHFFDGDWTYYIDPAAAVVIVALILWSTIPLVKRCSVILLQSTPGEVAVDELKYDLRNVPGVEDVHDLHCWILKDGVTIASVHVAIEEGIDWSEIVKELRGIFHEHDIHSTVIQPELVPVNATLTGNCVENCVDDCEEDWCCGTKDVGH